MNGESKQSRCQAVRLSCASRERNSRLRLFLGSCGEGKSAVWRRIPAGFTLIELLVVIAIIAILMGISFPAIQAAINRARVTRARSEVQSLQQAWLAYWNTYYDPVTDTLPPFWPTGVRSMDQTAVAVLAGEDAGNNPLGIVFMGFKPVDLAEGFRDPWRNLYQVELEREPTTAAETPWVYRTSVFLANVDRDME